MTDVDVNVHHRCTLVEHHSVLVSSVCEIGDADWHNRKREYRLSGCRRLMDLWCDAQGLTPLDVHEVTESDVVGYSWTVTVGKGDIHSDQSDPGVRDTWTFSARAGFWWRMFNRIRGAAGPPNDRTRGHLASVTPIRGLLPDRNEPVLPPLPPTCQTGTPWVDPWTTAD